METKKDTIDLPVIPIEIHYSISEEAKRVRDTLNRADWNRENGYQPLLPKGLAAVEVLSKDSIEATVSEEFVEEKYAAEGRALREAWTLIAERLFLLQQKIPNSHPLASVSVLITHYGNGGSYWYPKNLIELNMAARSSENPASTLAHESVHLMIEGFIRKYHVSHWQKERLVDLIVAEGFPELKHIQKGKLPEEEKVLVARLFKLHYPDIEAACKELVDHL